MITKEELIQKADLALDNIRPHLQVDGGDIEIVELTDEMELRVRWIGSCENCSMSLMTMKAGIEEVLKQKAPEIKTVVAINGINA